MIFLPAANKHKTKKTAVCDFYTSEFTNHITQFIKVY